MRNKKYIITVKRRKRGRSRCVGAKFQPCSSERPANWLMSVPEMKICWNYCLDKMTFESTFLHIIQYCGYESVKSLRQSRGIRNYFK